MAGEIVPADDLPGAEVPQNDLPQEIAEAESSMAISEILDVVRGYAQPAVDLVKKSALPTVGGVLGGMGGMAIGGPVGALAGSSGGAGLGEVANQALGITEQSPGQVVAALAMPAVAQGAVGVMRHIGGSLLKAFGGRQAVVDVATDITRRMLSPRTSAAELFTRALQSNAPIQTTRTAQAIDDIVNNELGNLPTATSGAIVRALEPLQVAVRNPGRTAQSIDAAVKDLRLEASLAYKSGNSRLGHTLSSVRNALFDDASASGNALLREAATASRREHAIDELAGVLRQAQPLKAFEDLAAKNRLFANTFSADEITQIRTLMSRISTAAPSGFSGVLGRTISASAGGMSSGVPGAVVGGMLPDIAAYTLTTAPGRRFMERLLTGGAFHAPQAAALATWARAQMAEDAQAGEIAQRFKDTLQNPSVSLEDKIAAAAERSEIIKNGKRGGASGSY